MKLGYLTYLIGLIFVIVYYWTFSEVRHLFFFIGLALQLVGVVIIVRKKRKEN